MPSLSACHLTWVSLTLDVGCLLTATTLDLGRGVSHLCRLPPLHCIAPAHHPDYRTIALTSHAGKVMLKILQARLQQYVNCELPDVQAGFSKGRGTRDQIANIRWILDKAKSSRKTSPSALLTMPKPWIVWITTNCGKFLKSWKYQTT